MFTGTYVVHPDFYCNASLPIRFVLLLCPCRNETVCYIFHWPGYSKCDAMYLRIKLRSPYPVQNGALFSLKSKTGYVHPSR